MPADDRNIDELIGLSDNELYLRLGREISGEAATPQGVKALVDRGKEFIDQEIGSLRDAVCGPDGPHAAVKSVTGATLVTAIANAIVSGDNIQMSHVGALYVAVLVLRTGLDNFCGGYSS